MIDFQCLRHTRAKKILRAMIMLYLILCSRMLKRHCRKARLRHLRDLRVIRVILRVIRTVVTRVLVSGLLPEDQCELNAVKATVGVGTELT